MAISATTIAEVRAGGSATNGAAFFDPGQNAGMFTDGAATAANTAAPVFTSASYNFVAGDVGAWVFIYSGTAWIPGWYKITSVASNAATLNATIASATLLSATFRPAGLSTVLGCATTASPTGATWSIDYSQQNASQVTYTDLASAGTGLTASSAGFPFGKQQVGNGLVIQSGTNFNAGRYVLASVDGSFVGTFVGPTNITTGAGASGAGRLGGAVAKLNDVGTLMVAGNTVFLNGSFSLGANDTFSVNGTLTLPIKIIGYGTVRGDGYLGRTNGNGLLITTNMPLLTYASTFGCIISGNYVIVETIKVVGVRSSSMLSLQGSATNGAIACSVTNSSTNAAATGYATGGSNIGSFMHNCDALLTGVSGALAAMNIAGNATRIIGCRITGGPGAGISVSQGCTMIGNVIYASALVGIDILLTTGLYVVHGNTIQGCGTDGVKLVTGATGVLVLHNNMITDNGGYGVNLVSAANAAFMANNRFRDNTLGNVNLGTGWTEASSYYHVTADGGGPESDYVSAGSPTYDFTLRETSPGYMAGLPVPASIGAIQRGNRAIRLKRGSRRLNL